MPDPLDLTSSQTVLSGALASAAFDHGRYAPGVVLAERYRIIGLLGRGGMGEVYRADDLTLGQSVALKFLPENVARDRGNLERLLSEVRTARQVSHPNVCRVHDVGEAGGRRFISMEYIDGEDLSVLLRRIGRLPADKCVEIARQLCAGLAASHERGVLHRDLKPANIMLDGRGRVRITDFGLATALQADGKAVGEFAGTPAYMAPEQLEGKPVSVQTDIYALGLVLYEIFTGKRFHNVASIVELRQRHAEAASADLSMSETLMDPAVARVIERCLESEPRRRPASCVQVAASLPGGDPLAAAIAAGETPSPQLVAAASVQGAFKPRTAVVLGVLFLVLLAFVSAGRWDPPRQFGLGRSVDVLSTQTRDLLASLGYPGEPMDRAAGFSYRYRDWTDPSVVSEPRPWAALRARRPAAVFFWYREHPASMSLMESSRLGLESLAMPIRGVAGITPLNPSPVPGSVYVERSPEGALDTLVVWPVAGTVDTNPAAGDVDWLRLFTEARLDMTQFTAAQPDAALATAGGRRRAWVAEAGSGRSAIRVEASESDGRPVMFRVFSPTTGLALGSVGPSDAVSVTGMRKDYIAVAFLTVTYLGAAFFMRRNFLMGRGDRRGAARLAKVMGALAFGAGWLAASPPFDIRIFATFHGAAAFGLFVGAWCWSFYIAIEPFVRRRWPRVLIGWSRLMAGEWRDPQVGREIFIGSLGALAMTGLYGLATQVMLRRGVEPPLNQDFTLRTLGGPSELVAALLQVAPWSVFVCLIWMVLLLLLRPLLRSDIAAAVVVAVSTLGLLPLGQWPFAAALLAGNLIGMALALRVGFLSLVMSLCVSLITGALPFAPASPGFIGTLSWLPVFVVVVPSLFGLYTSLAGQSIFGREASDDTRAWL